MRIRLIDVNAQPIADNAAPGQPDGVCWPGFDGQSQNTLRMSFIARSV